MKIEKSLRDMASEFIVEKRTLGFKYIKNEQVLARFLIMAEQDGNIVPLLDRETVERWCQKTPHEKESNRQRRIGIVREFARYVSRLGYHAYVPTKNGYPIYEERYLPYIFTYAELARLFKATTEVSDTKVYSFKSMQINLILKTLYSTGMRSGELTNLRKEDVDLDSGIMHVYGAKFNKERFIPVETSLLWQLRKYEKHMSGLELWVDAECFFVNSSGRKHKDVYHQFRRVLKLAGISHGGVGKGPRLHDLRHTFAVHCLRNWVREGKDLSAMLPYLSAYMGHAGMRGSQYYLRLTSELFPDIVEAMDTDYGWVIPEVAGFDIN